MSWTDNLGNIAKKAIDFTGVPGLVHDMSNILSNEDPWYIDGVNLVKDVTKIGTTPVRAAVKGLLTVGEKSYEAGGFVRQKMEEGLLDTPLMYNKFKDPGETYEAYRARVAANKDQISLGQATLSVLSPGKNAGERSGWFQDWSDNNLKFLSAGFDLFDPKDRKAAFQDQYMGKFITGAEDLVASTIIDPLTFTGFLGKGAVIAAKGTMYENINGRVARAVFGKTLGLGSTTDNFARDIDKGLEYIQTKGASGSAKAAEEIQYLATTDAKEQAGYWAAKRVTNPDAVAYMFGKVKSPEEVVDLYNGLMLKNNKAAASIMEKDPELGMMIDNISDVPKPNRDLINGKLDGDVMVDAEYNMSVGKFIEDLKANDDVFNAAYEKVATGRPFKYGFESSVLQNSRFGAMAKGERMFARTFAEPQAVTYLKTSLHPLLKVAHFFKEDVPSGVFNVNDGNSYQEFNTFLRQTNDLSNGAFRESSKELADRYLATKTPNERLDIIKEAERRAIGAIFPQYAGNQKLLDDIYKIYDARRASLIDRHNNQGFLGYFDNGQFINTTSPLLERQGANTVIIADLKRLKEGVDAHERVLPTLLQGIDVDNLGVRTQKTMAALDTINDIFKTSVLMRFGYTVRNLTEAQMSIMAKGFSLPAMVAANGKDGIKRFFSNRETGAQRLADNMKVLLGRKEDLGVVQHEVASQIDKIRAIDMAIKQLAKEVAIRVKEIEKAWSVGKTVKQLEGEMGAAGAAPGEAQALAFQEEYRILKGVLADLDSATYYHGSPKKFNLDPKRVLVTSSNPQIARGYAEGGTIHSAEQYIKTPSGRPGRLGTKPTPEGGTVSSPKREDIKDEAMIALQSDMIDAKNAGKLVEVKDRAGSWRKVQAIDYKTLVLATETDDLETVLFKDWSHRPVFRVGYTKGKVEPYRVYGKELRLMNWSTTPEAGTRLSKIADTWTGMPEDVRALFNNKSSEYKAWVKSKGWQDSKDPIFNYMRENGYGRLVVADDARAGGVSTIVLPEAIGNRGRENVVKRSVQGLVDKYNAYPTEAPAEITPAINRAKLRLFNKKASLGKESYAVSPYYTQDSLRGMINNGVEDAAANLARELAQAKAHLDDTVARLNPLISRNEETSVKQRLGFGNMELKHGDYTYTLPKVFEDATWFMSRTSGEQNWNALMSSQEMAFLAGIGSRSVRTIQPGDPKYFEGWANILNMQFRDPETGIMDPVVRMILDNKSDNYIMDFFRTQKGREYTAEAYTLVGSGKGPTKLKGGELEAHLQSKLNETRQAVAAYIPDNETALMLSAAKENGKPLSGGEVQQFLVNRFSKNPENLQPINGLLVTSSKEYKDQERLIDTFQRRVMRFLGSMPEDTFARHPLASAVYEKELRLNVEAMAKAKGSDRLTPEEINRAVANARETARTEVERTLFTIVRRSGASSSQIMKLMFPFFAAYENTLKRWGGMAAENPSLITTASRTVAQIVNGQMIVDQNGNQITGANQLAGSTQTANLVVRVPEGFIKALPASWQSVVENSFKNINIPLASLDVITQGNVGNPGFGPYATLPVALIVKQRPELEDAMKPFFPVGIPQNMSDIFAPSALRRLGTMYRKDDLYVRTYNQMLRYETYNYNQGKRSDEPTPKEIQDKTNKFFFLRALQSLTMPFAVAPEMDFYSQAYRNLQAKYANYVDPQTGKSNPGIAEAKFLEMYPDFFEATVSLSKNPGGIEPSIQTVRNLKKYSGLMAYADGKGDPELIGFLANDGDNQYTFSQAAYQWQYKHGPTPGAGSTYRQNRDSNELLREANIKKGWAQFQQIQSIIAYYKFQNGIESDSDPLMRPVKEAKSQMLQAIAKTNLDWYSEFVSPDRAKYVRRADILDKAFQNKEWMAANGNRPVVKNAMLYLETRKVISAMLDERKAAGGSRSLDANSNADIAEAFQHFRDNLIVGSNETEQFLNRYFANDTVVL
jgi:hypothetical protein